MDWQKIVAQGFATSTALLEFLNISPESTSPFVEKQFGTRVPLSFASRMEKGNRQDPLLKQVLADNAELLTDVEYKDDSLDELMKNPTQGLIHKYHGRVLLTLTGACAIHCRYCFRRHFPYAENNPRRLQWEPVMDYIRKDPSIREVILSGGDPFMVADSILKDCVQKLASISHVKILRIHTRIPVVLPERITENLCTLLSAIPLKKVVVLHSNHPQELDANVAQAVASLRKSDCLVLNQTVLLAGINDRAEILAELSEKLFTMDVLPYYLHVLDKVKGAQHFDMPLEKAQALYDQLQAWLPGYLLPKLVREDAGKRSKTLLSDKS